ncbi:ribose-5-phosphate isomerase A [Niallia oryzisoli]|uniref:ribose-5-phosphate isomerase A n=1 Tax=Niallia oryzisoli TaxID=1737571 RepID=UPI003735764C
MDIKKLLGDEAAKYVENNMIVGLGSGTTVNYLVRALGDRVQEGLQIKAVSSSEKTRRLAEEVGISLVDLNMIEQIDLTIDGANEIERDRFLR